MLHVDLARVLWEPLVRTNRSTRSRRTPPGRGEDRSGGGDDGYVLTYGAIGRIPSNRSADPSSSAPESDDLLIEFAVDIASSWETPDLLGPPWVLSHTNRLGTEAATPN